jgi:hypothetical protein
MNTDVFKEFLEKNVELSTCNKSYAGTLSRDVFRGTLTVTPTDKYVAKRFGPAIVDQNAVIAIRAILPREEMRDEDKKQGYYQQSCDDSAEDNG